MRGLGALSNNVRLPTSSVVSIQVLCFSETNDDTTTLKVWRPAICGERNLKG
jgi:hypothetical protein